MTVPACIGYKTGIISYEKKKKHLRIAQGKDSWIILLLHEIITFASYLTRIWKSSEFSISTKEEFAISFFNKY